MAEKYLISNEQVAKTVDTCSLNENYIFQQSVDALNKGAYDLAIIGFTAVLDRMLSDCSCQISVVNIKSRCDAIVDKLKEKGNLYIDELEWADFLLLITYPKALSSFGEYVDFSTDEPVSLNRHWIMHGRTEKRYSRLDCVKVLNMIYGTIRMGQLGEQDEQSDIYE